MTSEKLDKYLGQKVEITFFDNTTEIGVLERGDRFGFDKSHKITYGGKGYHIERLGSILGFKKSHVKKIKIVEGDRL